MLFWSRDPDISQHNTTDSVGEYEPGINGPSGMAGTRDADTMLGELLAALKEQGLDKTTDVFVTADHGFLTVSHASATSPSAQYGSRRAADRTLPTASWRSTWPARWRLPLFDPGRNFASVDYQQRRQAGGRRRAAGAIPQNPRCGGGAQWRRRPDLSAAAPMRQAAGRRHRQFPHHPGLCQRRFSSMTGWASFPARCPMSDVNLMGSARTPQPVHLCQFPQLRRRMRQQAAMHGRRARHAAGHRPGQPRLAVAGPRPAISWPPSGRISKRAMPIPRRSPMPTSRRPWRISPASSCPPRASCKGRVIRRSAGRAAAVSSVAKHTIQSAAGGEWRAHHPELPASGRARYFDAAGFAGKTVGLTPP